MARETTEEIERAMAEVSRAGLPVADLARITATLNADLTRGFASLAKMVSVPPERKAD